MPFGLWGPVCGVRKSGVPMLCIRPHTSCSALQGPSGGLSLRSGVCPAVPSSGASPGLIKSSPSCLADFLALSRPPCLLRAPCGRAPWFTRALAAPETGRTGRVRGAGVRSRWCSGGDAVSGVTPLRAGSLQVSCVPLGLPGTLRRPVWLELLS